jgi:UDP-N-acetylglucosamine acyltransferase
MTMSTVIHPTAVLSQGAEIGQRVKIGPYSVVGPAVRIGDGTEIGAHVVIDGVTTIGRDNVIVGQASLGGPPQDLSYKGEPTRLEVGDRNTIREFVTINRGTVKGGGITRIGDDCLFMACCHIAHDCDIRDRVILGNNVMLAGHVMVDQYANIAGAAGAHHFVTIGAFAYVGGMTRMVRDIPPYMIAEGHNARVRGVNVIGLQRAGYEEDDLEELRAVYRRLFRSGAAIQPLLEELRVENHRSGFVKHLIASLSNTELGFKGRYRESLRTEFQRLGVQRILEGEVDA